MPERLDQIQADVKRGLITVGDARFLLARLAKAEAVCHAVKGAMDNLAEFGNITDQEIYDAVYFNLATWQQTQREGA